MSNLTKSEIWARVEEDYNKLERDFPNSRILCTFAIGAVNRDSANVSSDIETISVIFPTIENIALNGGFIRQITYNKGGRHYIVDFREFYNNIFMYELEECKELFFTEYKIVNSLYRKVVDRLPYIKLNELVEEYNELIKEGILNIFNQYLTMRDGIQEKLFDALTKTEEKALIYILETVGGEGNVSISNAIANSGISRPVFTSLFEKLDRYKGAEIKNQGVKGTYINFYDHVLSKFEIEEK